MVQTPIDLTPWTLFEEDALPFFFNRVSESFRLQLHQHDFMELAYIDEGSGFHYVEEDVMQVAKNDLFILPIGVSHVFRPTSPQPNHPLIVYNCIFRPERLAEELASFPGIGSLAAAMQLLRIQPGGGSIWHRLRDHDGQIGAWFQLAYREYMQRRPGYIARLYSLFLELAVMLERHLQGEGHSADLARGMNDSLNMAVQYMDLHFAEPLTARQLAEACRMSERHFHRLFKSQLGCTFTSYVQNKRIEKSCSLLAHTRQSIQEIVQQVGYQDMKYFLIIFKKKTGFTPSEYRRLNALQPRSASAGNG
ncbi:helix-turn-helix domain-containing protein [Paenibacillus sepulcri]|uniref:AraC family transcriptional regulator n=1 Tax=Paenibacillus sepulcri TaxID=359917 RepID=A0ABS7CEF9_9BACL|nr:AraC family transcriptional regulator [Paenibacillus sepulcri]